VLVSHDRVTPGVSRLRVTNANPFPVTVNIPIDQSGRTIESDGVSLPLVDGLPTWTQMVSPSSTAELRYTVK
jgi:hypothetical protein